MNLSQNTSRAIAVALLTIAAITWGAVLFVATGIYPFKGAIAAYAADPTKINPAVKQECDLMRAWGVAAARHHSADESLPEAERHGLEPGMKQAYGLGGADAMRAYAVSWLRAAEGHTQAYVGAHAWLDCYERLN